MPYDDPREDVGRVGEDVTRGCYEKTAAVEFQLNRATSDERAVELRYRTHLLSLLGGVYTPGPPVRLLHGRFMPAIVCK